MSSMFRDKMANGGCKIIIHDISLPPIIPRRPASQCDVRRINRFRDIRRPKSELGFRPKQIEATTQTEPIIPPLERLKQIRRMRKNNLKIA